MVLLKGVSVKGIDTAFEGMRRISLKALFDPIKNFKGPLKYGFAVGRIKSRESGLLSSQQVERIMGDNYDDSLRVLMETGYGHYLSEARFAEDVEAGLREFLSKEYDFLHEISIDSKIEEFFQCRYDFHNIRATVKTLYFDPESADITLPFGMVGADALNDAILNDKLSELPDYYEGLVMGMKAALDVSRKSKVVDLFMDRAFLERRLQLAEEEKSRFMVNYVKMGIDIANIKIFIRSLALENPVSFIDEWMAEGGAIDKSLLLSSYSGGMEALMRTVGGTSYLKLIAENADLSDEKVRLTYFDRAADDFIMEYVKPAKVYAVGPEPIFGYLYAREREIVVLRIVLMGQLHRIDKSVIREKVRELYT